MISVGRPCGPVPRHQCRQHIDRRFCVRCLINASEIYPDSTFDLVQSEKDQNAESTAGNTSADRLTEADETAIHILCCDPCYTTLPNLRCDCHACSRLGFCSRCRKSLSHHALKAVTEPINDTVGLDDSESEGGRRDTLLIMKEPRLKWTVLLWIFLESTLLTILSMFAT